MMYMYRSYLTLLNDAYFHPARNTRYPNAFIRNMTFKAMRMLWHFRGLYVVGKFFDEDEIHRLLLEELIAIAISAVEVYGPYEGLKSIARNETVVGVIDVTRLHKANQTSRLS